VFLTVAICTKDRLDDLRRCVHAVCEARRTTETEILVIDDGTTPEPALAALTAEAGGAGFVLRYERKTHDFGLFNSRLVAARLAEGEVVLFLDDDAEIEREYLARLVAHYRDPMVAGVGGIDVLLPDAGLARRTFDRLFLLSSGSAGKLSPSAFNGSLAYWKEQVEPFPSDFLSGCNMSFRRTALEGLGKRDFLAGYSMGEDVVVSGWAARHGTLVVDPGLRVRHHASPLNRLKRPQHAYQLVRNSHAIARELRPGKAGTLASGWSMVGLLLKAALRPGSRQVVPAVLRGMLDVVRSSI
jgi:glycosyltransferase involved in cell wall biosynthesis